MLPEDAGDVGGGLTGELQTGKIRADPNNLSSLIFAVYGILPAN